MVFKKVQLSFTPLLMKSLVLNFVLIALCSCLQASAADDRPNVLFILTDDQGYGDLSLHGNPVLQTPTMDSIGEQGVRLDRFYVSPVCAPTRASLMTGRYHLRTGAFGVTRREEVVNPEEVTIAELMRDNGYATGCFGKWHNGTVFPETPNGQGFDEFLGFLGGVTQRYFDPELNHNGVNRDYQGYITEILAEAAMNWMGDQIAADKPFFCYVPFNAPHTPGLVEDKYWKPFYNKGVGRWEAVIYGMIQVIDEQIARMMEFLEEKNQAKDTIVIFMTDNGPNTWRYNAGLRGKKSHIYDGGIRVPCFIRWPGKLKPELVERPLSHVDILPTLAEWCGLKGTEGLALDGRSFAKLAESPGMDWSDRKLISFSTGQESKIRSSGTVHTDRWTAVQQGGKWELYDIHSDIRQRANVAEQHPEIVKSLRAHFEETLSTMPPVGQPAPIPVGASGGKVVVLEGQDAFLPKLKGKGIDYNYPAGFSFHWISRWTDTNAYPEWNLEVIGSGRYKVTLLYCIPEADLGVKAHLEIQNQRLPIQITEAFDPLPNPQPFLLEGEAAKYENKDWKSLELGEITLDKGHTTARILVTDIPGKSAMEVKEIILTKL
jgi:arylsulfatase A-like enzyme